VVFVFVEAVDDPQQVFSEFRFFGIHGALGRNVIRRVAVRAKQGRCDRGNQQDSEHVCILGFHESAGSLQAGRSFAPWPIELHETGLARV
jgi:hypothetical protein